MLVVCQVLSHDLENDPDVVAMIAASAALTISGVPFRGPILDADGELRLDDVESIHFQVTTAAVAPQAFTFCIRDLAIR